MNKSKAFVVLSCLTTLIATSAAEPLSPIFYASFDNGAKPEIAQSADFKIQGNLELAPGIKGNGAVVSRVNRIVYPVPENLDLDKGTITFWAKAVDWPEEQSTRHYFFISRGKQQWMLISMAAGHLFFQATAISSRPPTISSKLPWNNDEWRFVACVWNNKKAELYVDGARVGTTTWPQNLTELGSDFVIGGHLYGKTGGSIVMDELKIFDDALCAETIRQIYLKDFSSEVQASRQIIKKLDNISVDKFSHPKSRHIVGKPTRTTPLVDFECLEKWTVSYTKDDIIPIITRSKEEPLWDDYVMRVEFDGLNTSTREIVLRPPRPIEIANDFDSISIWAFSPFGNNNQTRGFSYSIQFRDAEGKLHSTGTMGNFLSSGWGIHHFPLNHIIKAPGEFVSVTFRNFNLNDRARIYYFDNLRFYLRSQKELADAYIPSFEELGVPVREETILPTSSSPGVVKLAKNSQGWRYSSVDNRGKSLIFDINPRSGTLDDISTTYNGKTFSPLTNGGFHWAIDNTYPVSSSSLISPNSSDVRAQLIGGSINENILTLNWKYYFNEHAVHSKWILQVIDNTLIVDLSVDSGLVGEFKLGAITGLQGQVIEVPYLYLGRWMRHSVSPGIFAGDDVYISCFIDWYNSDASGLFGESSAAPGGRYELCRVMGDHRWVPDRESSTQTHAVRDYSIINGGSYYWPKNDGSRNPARERFFLTVSDSFDAVLPNIPHVSHNYVDETAKDVWATRMWYTRTLPVPDYFDRELAMWKLCKAYGMENINVRLHVNINRMYYPRRSGDPSTFIESFVEPGIGGDKKCAEFFDKMRKLGYRIGVYTNPMLLNPLSDAWDEDMLNLDSNNNWLFGSGVAKQTKISRLLDLQKKYHSTIKRKFSPNCAYIDQTTCPPPWRYTDYDARTPDAGKFSAPYKVFIESLRLEERYFGPVLSEGRVQMLFAGLCDNYAQPQREDMNVIPNFQLNKLHMLSNDCGYHLSTINVPRRRLASATYRLLAFQYAYGNTGHLAGTYHGAPYENDIPDPMIKSYFLIQPLQKFFAQVPISEILYNVNGKLAPIEEAIVQGTLETNQTKLVYANGLQVATNLNTEKNFRVKLHDKYYLLPPDGFAAYLPGEAEAFSAIVDQQRVDYLKTRVICYTDGLGVTRHNGPITAKHSYTLTLDGETRKLTPSPFKKEETITVDTGWIETEFVIVAHLGVSGETLKNVSVPLEDGKLKLLIDGKTFSYLVEKDASR